MRVPLPAIDEPVGLDQAGQHVLFVEHHPEDLPGEFEVVLENAEGEPVDLFQPDAGWSYEADGLTGDAFVQFDVEEPGTYVLSGGYMDEGDGRDRFAAVGPWDSAGGPIGLTVLGFLGMIATVVGGLVLLLVTWLLRRKARRAAA